MGINSTPDFRQSSSGRPNCGRHPDWIRERAVKEGVVPTSPGCDCRQNGSTPRFKAGAVVRFVACAPLRRRSALEGNDAESAMFYRAVRKARNLLDGDTRPPASLECIVIVEHAR